MIDSCHKCNILLFCGACYWLSANTHALFCYLPAADTQKNICCKWIAAEGMVGRERARYDDRNGRFGSGAAMSLRRLSSRPCVRTSSGRDSDSPPRSGRSAIRRRCTLLLFWGISYCCPLCPSGSERDRHSPEHRRLYCHKFGHWEC